jgi:DNA adenine methylase
MKEGASPTSRIVSPLRYPGGKSKALKRILPLVPAFEEFREPMVGGGSVFFALKNEYPDKKYWINDANTELYLFWKYCKEKPNALVSEIAKFKRIYRTKVRRKTQGRKLFKYLKAHKKSLTPIQRAARFFILNRITFSGLVETGGYSKQAFRKRFTTSSIERIRKASEILKGVRITNIDYGRVVRPKGEGVFIFLDPPYMSKTEHKLYGEHGTLHLNFNHQRFAKNIKKCGHNWLITYDKCSGVQKLYTFANSIELNIQGWNLQYGTNNGATNQEEKKANIGKELFIFNYSVEAYDRGAVDGTKRIKA